MDWPPEKEETIAVRHTSKSQATTKLFDHLSYADVDLRTSNDIHHDGCPANHPLAVSGMTNVGGSLRRNGKTAITLNLWSVQPHMAVHSSRSLRSYAYQVSDMHSLKLWLHLE